MSEIKEVHSVKEESNESSFSYGFIIGLGTGVLIMYVLALFWVMSL